MTNYEQYQLEWMISHGHSLYDLIKELEKVQYDEDGSIIPVPVGELFMRWETDSGFGSEIWACEEEWMESEGAAITKAMIRHGINRGLITFGVDPNLDSGTICKIGDNWFYFGGETAAEMNPEEYLKAVPQEDIINEIFDVLDDFKDKDEFVDEYMYYLDILNK